MNRILIFLLAPLGISFAEKTPEQRIDELVAAGLSEQKIESNAAIDDETFLRRVYLNIAGRIPTIEEAEKFHTIEYPNKREQLIQQLLEGEGYVSNAYHFWADLLRITGRDGATSDAYQLWLKDSLRENKPYDQMVRELVTAQGMVWDNGAIGYYMRDRGMPLDNMSNTVRIFLGVRLECAQCHDHPFDKWTQMDYYKMAAFSYDVDARNYATPNKLLIGKHTKEAAYAAFQETVQKETGLKEVPRVGTSEKSLEKVLSNSRTMAKLKESGVSERQFRRAVEKGIKAMEEEAGDREGMRKTLQVLYDPLKYISVGEKDRDLQLPHDYQYSNAKPFDVVEPATMFGAQIDVENVDHAMTAYAEWMTSKENPTFTRVIANRLWKEVFGVGIIEPVDEITDLTEPTNPQLMEYLEELIRDLDYDIKEYLAILYNTETYQSLSHNSELVMGEPYYFQGPVLRRMSAEQMWDSVVALALPEVDHYKPRLKNQLASVEKQRRIYSSLEDRSFDEFLAMVKEITPLITEKYEMEAKAREKIFEAQRDGDQEKYTQLRRELKEQSKSISNKISEIGYIHLHEKVDGEDLLAALGMNDVGAGMMKMEADSSMVVTRLPKVDLPKAPKELSKNEQRKWATEQKADYNMYRSLISGMARASELPSPAPRGHFLRDFGQSDREIIENAANSASVPQALNLLNGKIVEALINRHSVFGKRIHAAGDPEDKTRMIFQAMLTREPTEAEMELVRAEIEAHGDDAYEGIVWALLNTQQFMFVQ
ncbi:MAG: DUF1549 domain-containing protein [Verrucomicrobiota bacterium]